MQLIDIVNRYLITLALWILCHLHLIYYDSNVAFLGKDLDFIHCKIYSL